MSMLCSSGGTPAYCQTSPPEQLHPQEVPRILTTQDDWWNSTSNVLASASCPIDLIVDDLIGSRVISHPRIRPHYSCRRRDRWPQHRQPCYCRDDRVVRYLRGTAGMSLWQRCDAALPWRTFLPCRHHDLEDFRHRKIVTHGYLSARVPALTEVGNFIFEF